MASIEMAKINENKRHGESASLKWRRRVMKYAGCSMAKTAGGSGWQTEESAEISVSKA
jgi:hypothetical protein